MDGIGTGRGRERENVGDRERDSGKWMYPSLHTEGNHTATE